MMQAPEHNTTKSFEYGGAGTDSPMTAPSLFMNGGFYAEKDIFAAPGIAANVAFVVQRRKQLKAIDERLETLRESTLIDA